MINLTAAIRVELLKARRSRMPLLTALGFSLAPLTGGFFMVVMKDPDLARRMGIISAKAQIMAGSADWATYLGFLAQAVAVGGLVVFSLVASWIFGREFVDRTAKDLLALPTPRFAVVLAKFVVFAGWSAVLTTIVYLVGLGVGLMITLPGLSEATVMDGAITAVAVASMTIAVATPIAFAASAGRGYLPPMGAAILALVLAQVVAAAGWGPYFPWSAPALYAGMGGPDAAGLGPISGAVIVFTSLAGLAGTFSWWELADHAQ